MKGPVSASQPENTSAGGSHESPCLLIAGSRGLLPNVPPNAETGGNMWENRHEKDCAHNGGGNNRDDKFNVGLPHEQNYNHGHKKYGNGAEVDHFGKCGHAGCRKSEKGKAAFKGQIGGVKGGRAGKYKGNLCEFRGLKGYSADVYPVA